MLVRRPDWPAGSGHQPPGAVLTLLANRHRHRTAFDAIVCSLGLTDENVLPDHPVVERLHIVNSDPAPTLAAATEAEPEPVKYDVSAEKAVTATRRSKTGGKRNFTIKKGPVFAPADQPTLEQFVAEKQPRNMNERNLVPCMY